MADEMWSNLLSPAPITRDAVDKAIRDVERFAYAYTHGRVGRGRLTFPLPDPMPPWVYDVAQGMGWIDEQGNVTREYWKIAAEAKRARK